MPRRLPNMIKCQECGESFAAQRAGTDHDGRPVIQDLCPDCRALGPKPQEPDWIARIRPNS